MYAKTSLIPVGAIMIQFILGFIFGLYVATHGVDGMAQALEQTVDAVKTVKITTEQK